MKINQILGLVFIAVAAHFAAGCSTFNANRATPMGTEVTEVTTAPGYSRTDVFTRSRQQYRECLEARGAQAGRLAGMWTDDQASCFGQTTTGQALIQAGYPYGSPLWNAYGSYFAGYPGGGYGGFGYGPPMATPAPNIAIVNGRPMVFPRGANVNDGVGSAYSVYNSAAFEELRRRAPVAEQPVLQGATTTAPAAAQPAAISREDWEAMTEQVTAIAQAQARAQHRH